jgi:uncharacterized protein YjiK
MKISIIFFLVLIVVACAKNQEDMKTVPLTEVNIKNSFKLDKQLNEISGLTFNDQQKLFAHNDEKGHIYQLDLQNGEIVKKFEVGDKTVKEDFEGIAFANNMFYLVTSNGDIYEFSEGKDGEEVKYEKHKTFLDADNDVEGLCYDAKNNSLLLACKGDPGKKHKGNRAIYEFRLQDKELKKDPRFLLPVKEIMKNYATDFSSKLGEFFLIKDDTFSPSGIEYNQAQSTFFILSFKGRMIVEISEAGTILNIYTLDPENHRQPEGITFTQDNLMIISDEAAGEKAMLTVYELP